MVTPSPSGDREKVVSKLPAWLRRDLKVRAAQLDVDIQDAVSQGIEMWQASNGDLASIDTAGGVAWSSWLPPGQWAALKETCAHREMPLVQGLAQSVALWLHTHSAPPPTPYARRIVVCNQKGGVGKTTVAAGLAGACAEDTDLQVLVAAEDTARQAFDGKGLSNEEIDLLRDDETHPGLGLRVLLVDYDPQGHLTQQLGLPLIGIDDPSLAKYMAGTLRTGSVRDLIVTVEDRRFGGRLDVLPSCADAFLLDVMIAMDRNRQATLERVLEPLEADYDVIIVDGPPSLGVGMDAGIYYARRRDNEAPGNSGVLIPVQAEDSSGDAYTLLRNQIDSGQVDWRIQVDDLGLVVNLYDARDGYVVTSSLEAWRQLKEPRMIGVINRLKEQREAVRNRQSLMSYAPSSQQAKVMRRIAREIV
ncbi:ParA family protein [Streptomyces sp. NPDC000349]|uniref:ParA family protein n=1 Tax=unclassified Streptomyces TaxID=2593676 RepID=UPI00277F73A5|nr:ParA family protein [Streptomyces sp. DSM 40167]MDQ0408863.1 chromosome partitioning protein [Streptomyces sp. DSM 40167]